MSTAPTNMTKNNRCNVLNTAVIQSDSRMRTLTAVSFIAWNTRSSMNYLGVGVNQLYAINRPDMTTAAHNVSPTAPASLAPKGNTGSMSHRSTVRYVERWKASALTPAISISTTLIQKRKLP